MHALKQRDKQADIPTYSKGDGQPDRLADSEKDRQAGTQVGRQAGGRQQRCV